MEEPGIITNESQSGSQQKKESKPKESLASILAIGIIIGFLVILFAIIAIIIQLIPSPDKWTWLLTEATMGNWILLIGTGLLLFFFALVISIYIWKKGREFLLKRI
jgi:hypothetical protein